jgi:hypothetical protein
MAWYRVQLTAAVQEVVIAERECHPQSHVRRKMLVLWLLPCGITRAKAATVAGLGRATVQRYVAAYRDGGLDGLRQWDVTGPVSDLASFTDAISASLNAVPVRPVKERRYLPRRLARLKRMVQDFSSLDASRRSVPLLPSASPVLTLPAGR